MWYKNKKNGNTTLWNSIKIWLDKIKWSHFYYYYFFIQERANSPKKKHN
jgi:hypothetical protein